MRKLIQAKIKHSIFFISLVMLVAPSVGRALSAAGTPSASAAETAEVKIGDKLQAAGLTVEPVEVIDDSRCPTGEHCFWAGLIVIKVRVSDAQDSKELLLGLTNHKPVSVNAADHSKYKNGAVQFKSYDLFLTSAEPQRSSADTKIAPSAYEFKIKVAPSKDRAKN